jgi:hypothetical protein
MSRFKALAQRGLVPTSFLFCGMAGVCANLTRQSLTGPEVSLRMGVAAWLGPGHQALCLRPGRTKALLAQAGFPNGFDTVYKIRSGPCAHEREVCQAIAGMFAQAAIRAKVIALERGEFLRRLRTQEPGPLSFAKLAPPDDPQFQVSQYRSDWLEQTRIPTSMDCGAQEKASARACSAVKSRAMPGFAARLKPPDGPVLNRSRGPPRA